MDEGQEPPSKSRRPQRSVLELLVHLGLFDEGCDGADARQLARVNRSLRAAVKFWRRDPLRRRDPLWRRQPPWDQNPLQVLIKAPAAGELTDFELQLLDEACERSASNVSHVLCVVAERGTVEALESVWVRHAQGAVGGGPGDVLASAASGGRLANMEWALSRGFGLSACAFESAAGHGHLGALQWLHQRGCAYRAEACLAAAAGGHLHVLQWMEDTADLLVNPTYTDVAAARGGHVHILQWIYDRNPLLIDQYAWDEAVSAGKFRAMQWMEEMPVRSWRIPNSHGQRFHYCETAVQHGNMDMLVHYFGTLAHTDGIVQLACAYGRLEMVKYLHQTGVPLCKCAWLEAAAEGHLELLQWLAEHMCPVGNALGLVEAAEEGHLHVLKWLLARKELAADAGSAQRQQWLDRIHGAVDARVAEWLRSPQGSRAVSAWSLP